MEILFAANVRALHEEANLTQKELADRMETTQRKVSYWESGKIEPDLASLWRLADLFCVSVDELIGRSD